MTWGPVDHWLAAFWRRPIRVLCWLTGRSALAVAAACVWGVLAGGAVYVTSAITHHGYGAVIVVVIVVLLAFVLAWDVSAMRSAGAGVLPRELRSLGWTRMGYSVSVILCVVPPTSWSFLPCVMAATLGSYAVTEDIPGGPSLFARARDALSAATRRLVTAP